MQYAAPCQGAAADASIRPAVAAPPREDEPCSNSAAPSHTDSRTHMPPSAAADEPGPERNDPEPAVDAIVTAWCLEGDASVLLPQLRRRFDDIADVLAQQVERSETAIAKRLTTAIVRKIRSETAAAGSSFLTHAFGPTAIDTSPLLDSRSSRGTQHSSTTTLPSAVGATDCHDNGQLTPQHGRPPQARTDARDARDTPTAVLSVSDLTGLQLPTPHHHNHLFLATPAGRSDWFGGSPMIDLFPPSANSSITHRALDVNASSLLETGPTTAPPSTSPSQLNLGLSETKVRKELTRATTDIIRTLLDISRQLVTLTKSSATTAVQVKLLEMELAAAKATAAGLEQELLHVKQFQSQHHQPPAAAIGTHDPQPHASGRRETRVGDEQRSCSSCRRPVPQGLPPHPPSEAVTLERTASRHRRLHDDPFTEAEAHRCDPPGVVRDDTPNETCKLPPLSIDSMPALFSPPEGRSPLVDPRGRESISSASQLLAVRRLTKYGRRATAFNRDVVVQPRAEESTDDIGMPMLNQYVILSELGAGCQGTVNLALDTETEELRAIKVIARPIATSGVGARKQRENAAKLAQLQREIAIMKRCRHRNVVALFEVIDDPEADSMYLVMQYVEKGSVAKQTDNGETTPIDGATLASYAKQLCSGLQYLHSRGIVHRDVKPENLLLGANGVVYLSDFGISSVDETSGVMTPRVSSASADATAAQQHHCSGGGLTEALRHSPSTRGTIAFLAPEVLSSETTARFTYSPCTPLEEHHDDSRAPVDNVLCARETLLKGIPPDTCSDATTLEKKQVDGCAADVWALGMSLYVMLYGQLPWPATNAADYMDHVTSADAAIPYPAATRDGHVITEHEEWRSLLSRMICRDVKQRMTAAEAHEAAKRLVHKYSDSDATAPVVAVDDVEHAITVLRRPAQH